MVQLQGEGFDCFEVRLARQRSAVSRGMPSMKTRCFSVPFSPAAILRRSCRIRQTCSEQFAVVSTGSALLNATSDPMARHSRSATVVPRTRPGQPSQEASWSARAGRCQVGSISIQSSADPFRTGSKVFRSIGATRCNIDRL